MKRIYFFALTNQNILIYLLMQSLLNNKTFHPFKHFSLQNKTDITEKITFIDFFHLLHVKVKSETA